VSGSYEYSGPFYCPAFKRNPDTSRGPACMTVLPCTEHGIQDQNQGHRVYGRIISDVPEDVDVSELGDPVQFTLPNIFWKPGDPGTPVLNEHDLWMQEHT
jgi:hypothetical protein